MTLLQATRPACRTRELDLVASTALVSTCGATRGSMVAGPTDLVLDDCYRLMRSAEPQVATIVGPTRTGAFVAEGREVTLSGRAWLTPRCLLTFMAPDGSTTHALMVTLAQRDMIALLGPMDPTQDHVLVAIDQEGAAAHLADLSDAAFPRGTRITLANGRMAPIETLQPGDRVLTRDSGAQTLSGVMRSLDRADGPRAPIRIRAGVLNNAADLIVSPGQMIAVPATRDLLSGAAGRAFQRAASLVDGVGIQRQKGGYAERYELVFDTEQVIFAEGIATLSSGADQAATATPRDGAETTVVPLGARRRA